MQEKRKVDPRPTAQDISKGLQYKPLNIKPNKKALLYKPSGEWTPKQ